jgi:hypothetical protein
MAYAYMTVEQDGTAGQQEQGKQFRELIRQFQEIEDASEVEGAWRGYTRVWEKEHYYYSIYVSLLISSPGDYVISLVHFAPTFIYVSVSCPSRRWEVARDGL